VHIHSWLLLGETPKRGSTHPITSSSKQLPTIIFFHGNAGNIGLRIPQAIQILMQLERKVHVLLVEYRGYGDSDNVPPNEIGIQLDAQAAMHFCINHPKIDSNHIFVYGQSLGGAVAFHLAHYCQTHHPPLPLAGIIVENTFLSISKMVDQLMPKIIVFFKPLVLRIQWNTEHIVTTLQNIPILYLAGEKDELVPHHHMQQLYTLSKSFNQSHPTATMIQIHVVSDGTHNDTWMVGGQPYWNAMRNFLYAVVAQNQQRSSQPQPVKTYVSTSPPTTSTDSQGSIPLQVPTETTYVVPTMSTNILGMAQDAFGKGSKQKIDEKIKDL
jgi:abhydrolase domain-containing protein 13